MFRLGSQTASTIKQGGEGCSSIFPARRKKMKENAQVPPTHLLLAIGEPDYNSLETKGVGVEVGG